MQNTLNGLKILKTQLHKLNFCNRNESNKPRKISMDLNHFFQSGSDMEDNRKLVKMNSQDNHCSTRQNVISPSSLGVEGMNQNGPVSRQVSSSSLCSWSSFDTALTDDNSSETDDISNDNNIKSTTGLTFSACRKVSI